MGGGHGLRAWLGASLFPSAVMDTDDTAPPTPVCVCGDSCVAMQGDSWGGGWGGGRISLLETEIASPCPKPQSLERQP